MEERLFKNEFVEENGVFTREFRGGYTKRNEISLEFEMFRDVIVAKAQIYKLNNKWVLTLYKINPINGVFVKEYDNISVEEEDMDGNFFNLLLASVYVDK